MSEKEPTDKSDTQRHLCKEEPPLPHPSTHLEKNSPSVDDGTQQQGETSFTPEPSTKPQECTIRHQEYDSGERQPRNLPCGHTVCSHCVDHPRDSAGAECYECHLQHEDNTVTQFMKKINLDSVTSSSSVISQDLITVIGPIKEKQVGSLTHLLTRQDNMRSQLDNYKSQVNEWKSQLMDTAQKLEKQVKEALQALEEEEEEVNDFNVSGKIIGRDVKRTLIILNKNKTPIQTLIEIERAERHHQNLKVWMTKFSQVFPCPSAVVNTVKAQEAVKRVLEVMDTQLPNFEEELLKELSIKDKVDLLLQRAQNTVTPTTVSKQYVRLSADDMRTSPNKMKKILQTGRLFAVQASRSNRSAEVLMSEGRLCVHVLQDVTPPPDAYVIDYNEVMTLVKASPTLAFLDLRWTASAGGRVYINVNPYTGRGNQFLLLCMGEKGPSYADAVIINVGNEGEAGEFVRCGDYERNNGSGGAAIVEDLEVRGIYEKPLTAGTVAGWWWSDEKIPTAQFTITTRDGPEGNLCPTAFGEVVSGLEVVKEAVKCVNHCQVNVVSCGVVVSP
ncbi:uncharacterized protein LOC121872447 [Homarus americanus]|uniref:uncharacterized protein LOC121872447 n=1 Tax=Homarus americanus TaxID=6706 RepID=UPI001C48088E|nr:uncharacterized protein LOC121872447 [Homarus americanus]